MGQFTRDYLFRLSVEPDRGYRDFQKRKKPYYVIAESKADALKRLEMHLRDGWRVSKVSLLGPQFSGVIYGGQS